MSEKRMIERQKVFDRVQSEFLCHCDETDADIYVKLRSGSSDLLVRYMGKEVAVIQFKWLYSLTHVFGQVLDDFDERLRDIENKLGLAGKK